MKKSLELLKKDFESSSELTEEFQEFYNTFKRELTKELESVGAEKFKFYRGHFYVSGFFAIGDQVYYFSLSDVRGMSYNPDNIEMMYRQAKDFTDYTGFVNQWIKIEPGMARKMNL